MLTIPNKAPMIGQKGPWWCVIHEPEGTKGAVVCCPCGQKAYLSDHTIADDGTVSPSLACPADGCDFHENVKLEGWEP